MASVDLEHLLALRRALAGEVERDTRRDLAAVKRERDELVRLRQNASRAGAARQPRLARPLEAVQRRLQRALQAHRETLSKASQLQALDAQIAALHAAQTDPQPAAEAASELT